MEGEAEDDAPGVPEWVVTYGDMMSLLLTFFIMLVSLSEMVADEKYRAILDALEQKLGYLGGPISPPGTNFPLNSLLESMDTQKLGSHTDKDRGKGGVKKKSTEGKDLNVFHLKEGKPVIAGQRLWFENESTILTPQTEEELVKISRSLAGKPNKIEVRCFTNRILTDRVRTDHERMQIAYARGRKIKWKLEKFGIEPIRIRIAVDLMGEQEDENGNLSHQKSDFARIVVLDAYAKTFVGRPSDYNQ